MSSGATIGGAPGNREWADKHMPSAILYMKQAREITIRRQHDNNLRHRSLPVSQMFELVRCLSYILIGSCEKEQNAGRVLGLCD